MVQVGNHTAAAVLRITVVRQGPQITLLADQTSKITIEGASETIFKHHMRVLLVMLYINLDHYACMKYYQRLLYHHPS